MSDWFMDVLMFNRKFNCPLLPLPAVPTLAVRELKLRLVTEEANELRIALEKHDVAGIADACADLIYVTIGAAQACGIDLRPVWDAVQAANMAKVGGARRGDGKILKPPGWTPPNVSLILARQRSLSVPVQAVVVKVSRPTFRPIDEDDVEVDL